MPHKTKLIRQSISFHHVALPVYDAECDFARSDSRYECSQLLNADFRSSDNIILDAFIQIYKIGAISRYPHNQVAISLRKSLGFEQLIFSRRH